MLDESTSLHYKGKVKKLPDDIGRHFHARLSTAKIILYVGGIPVTPDDNTTNVAVVAENKPIRSILSDYLPLSHYSRCLWVGLDRTKDEKTIECFYFGPLKEDTREHNNRPKKREDSANTTHDFTEGREAYLTNSFSDNTVDAATKFIELAFESGRTLQVRWAILYLGKYKVEHALPLLFSHLEYQYTNCPVLTEAYPALHALIDFGVTASTLALKQMEAETDPLRLRLLCALMVGTQGSYQGRKQIHELIGHLPQMQRERIIKALETLDDRLIAVPPPDDSNAKSPNSTEK